MEGNPVHPVAHASPVTTTDETAAAGRTDPPSNVALPERTNRALRALVIVGAIALVVGCFVDLGRVAAGMLVGAHFILGISLGGLAFVVFGYVTRAGWFVVPRRVAEGMAGVLPVAAVATFIALLLGLMGSHPLYEWANADHVAGDKILEGKAGWLDSASVILRALIYIAVWTVFCFAIRHVSLRQDKTGGIAATNRNT